MNHEDILKERGSTYGEFEDNAVCTHELVEVFMSFVHKNPYFQKMAQENQEALIVHCEGMRLALHKISRIACGILHEDNYVDGGNYLKLAYEGAVKMFKEADKGTRTAPPLCGPSSQGRGDEAVNEIKGQDALEELRGVWRAWGGEPGAKGELVTQLARAIAAWEKERAVWESTRDNLARQVNGLEDSLSHAWQIADAYHSEAVSHLAALQVLGDSLAALRAEVQAVEEEIKEMPYSHLDRSKMLEWADRLRKARTGE